MEPIQRRTFLQAATAAVLAPTLSGAADPAPLTVIVMDPLAAPLSCPCVKGYAQRDYEKLAKFLEGKLGRPVKVAFGESLTNTLAKKTDGKADLIIGKESVVRHEAVANKMTVAPVAALAGKDGKTTMTGLMVASSQDPVVSAADLGGHTIVFGGPECDEKYTAAIAMLKELGVKVPEKPETCASCSDGATRVIAAVKNGEKVATVISSYAQPLLEGCGTIQKGDLKVIGKTDEVPFVVAFVADTVPTSTRDEIRTALLAVGADKDLSTALETKGGFVALHAKKN